MNTEGLSNQCEPKKDYEHLYKVLKLRCEEISKDNDALSSRLINLKLLIYKAENQCRKLQDRLEYHGVDYHSAAAAANSSADINEFSTEKVDNIVKSRPKHIRKKQSKSVNKNQAMPSDSNHYPLPTNATTEFDNNLSSFSMKSNLII